MWLLQIPAKCEPRESMRKCDEAAIPIIETHVQGIDSVVRE
jgi:hypothetical protein